MSRLPFLPGHQVQRGGDVTLGSKQRAMFAMLGIALLVALVLILGG